MVLKSLRKIFTLSLFTLFCYAPFTIADDDEQAQPTQASESTAEVAAEAAATMQEAEMPTVTDTTVADTAEPTTEAASTPSKYHCELQGLVRRVEIEYANDTTVPCDVNYYKDSEAPGEINTLWSAQNLEGYCEQKASEFVEKLQSWGWTCSGQ